MSGWGGAGEGTSVAAWACEPGDEAQVLDWVNGRDEMKRVRQVSDPYRPKCAHCHIYVVTEGHTSLKGG